MDATALILHVSRICPFTMDTFQFQALTLQMLRNVNPDHHDHFLLRASELHEEMLYTSYLFLMGTLGRDSSSPFIVPIQLQSSCHLSLSLTKNLDSRSPKGKH